MGLKQSPILPSAPSAEASSRQPARPVVPPVRLTLVSAQDVAPGFGAPAEPPSPQVKPTSARESVSPYLDERARATERLMETDRRPVSILFADLSGFTALSERLDPEDVRAFQSNLFTEMALAIEQYEGFVEKFVGDAVMAVFGAPLAHEDDPERALRAALAMQERMEGLNR